MPGKWSMTPDLYWIRDLQPLRLAIMPRPRGGEWLADEIAAWSALGLQTVVSLLHQYEASELEITDAGELCERHGIRYRSFPILDRGVPDHEATLLTLVDELAASVRAGAAVAVHCRAGIGRSALVAGCVLLRL